MPVCPRAPGVQLPSKSDMELPVPYKRYAYNLTCYGLLRPVTVSGDGRQFTDGDLVRLPADSVCSVGHGVKLQNLDLIGHPCGASLLSLVGNYHW